MANIPFLNNTDHNLNQLLNVILQRLGSHPASPTEGQAWYYNPEERPYYRSSSANVGLLTANTTLDQVAAPGADVSLASHKITNLATPTSAGDAANKSYVDSVASGLKDNKESVRAATTANISLTGAQTIDGVSVIAGDRVLVKDQSTGSQNGIYVAAAGAWSRSTDADSDAEVTPGMFAFVEEGTVNGDTGWVLATNAAITVGTTALTFTQFSSTAAITGGAGLVKTGNTLDVVGTADRITANADSIDIAATYVGQTSITTLGTIATGTWSGTAIAVAKGGTGATTAAAARANLGTVSKYSALLSGSATTYTVTQATHGCAADRTNIVEVLEESTGQTVYADISQGATGTISIIFAVAPTSNQYRVTIIG